MAKDFKGDVQVDGTLNATELTEGGVPVVLDTDNRLMIRVDNAAGRTAAEGLLGLTDAGRRIYQRDTQEEYIWDGTQSEIADSTGVPRELLTNTSVSPAITGLPTIQEIQAAVTAAGLSNVLAYYTGGDTPLAADEDADEVFWVDDAGVATKIDSRKQTSFVTDAQKWSVSGAEPVVQVDDSNRSAARFADNDGASTSYYQSQYGLPTTSNREVRIIGELDAAATSSIALQFVDFGGNNGPLIAIDPTDGSAISAAIGLGPSAAILDTRITDDHFEVIARFPAFPTGTAWRLYPAYSSTASPLVADASQTGSMDLLELDLDYRFVSPELSATTIDSGGATTDEVLPAASGGGDILFFHSADVTNTATLSVPAGESLNGVVDGQFFFSNYAAGTQFRADDIAVGEWVVSVVGASATRSNENYSVRGIYEVDPTNGLNVVPLGSLVDSITVEGGTFPSYERDASGIRSGDTLVIPATAIYDLYVSITHPNVVVGSTGANNTNNGTFGGIRINGTTIEWIDEDGAAGLPDTYKGFISREFTAGDVIEVIHESDAETNEDYIVAVELRRMQGDEVVLAGMVQPTKLSYFQASRLSTVNSTGQPFYPWDEALFADPAGELSIATTGNVGAITGLKAGRTYKLTANIQNPGDANGNTILRFVNVTTDTSFGDEWEVTSSQYANNASNLPSQVAYYTPVADCDVSIDYVGGSSGEIGPRSTLSVEELPSSSVVNPDTVPVEDLEWMTVYLASIATAVVDGGVNKIPFDTVLSQSGSLAFANGKVTLKAGNTYSITNSTRTNTAHGTTVYDFTNGVGLGGKLAGHEGLNAGGQAACLVTPATDIEVGIATSNGALTYNGIDPLDPAQISANVMTVQQVSSKTITYVDPAFTEAKDLSSRHDVLNTSTAATADTAINFGANLTNKETSGAGITYNGDGTWTVQPGRYRFTASVQGASASNAANYWWAASAAPTVRLGASGNFANSSNSVAGSDAPAVYTATLSAVTTLAVVTGSAYTVQGGTFVDSVPSAFLIEQLPSTEYVTPGDVPVEDLAYTEIVRDFDGSGAQVVNTATNFASAADLVLSNGTTALNSGGNTVGANSITIGQTGRYRISAMVNVDDNGGGPTRGAVFLGKNGAQLGPTVQLSVQSSFAAQPTQSQVVDLVAGDVISVKVATDGAEAWSVLGFTVSVQQLASKTVIRPEDVVVDDQADSGYFDIGNMRYQFGRSASNGSGDVNVSMPAPMANASYSVSLTPAGSGAVGYSAFYNSETTTSFQVKTTDNGVNVAVSFSWIVVGLKP